MNYLGMELNKPRIGVFDFTCCEGCQLQLANKEESLVDFLELVHVVNFREISSDRQDDYAVALIEGCISREDEIERLKLIRTRAKVLVALGTCACFGGVNHLKGRFPLAEVVEEVYGKDKVETADVRPIRDIVAVDLEIPGCPVSKPEVERIVVNLVTGTEIKFPKYPVCVECKQNLNTCVFDLGTLCLGPVTRAGCGAVCPDSKAGCLGCRGPAEDANFASLFEIVREKGFPMEKVRQAMNFFNAFGEVPTE